MKKNNFKKALLAGLVLTSSAVYADDQYPAADFQPTVVYQDESYIANSAKAPSSTASASATTSTADDKYPAANFQPQVVYNDPDYKHNTSLGNSSSASSSSSSATSAAGSTATAAADTKSSDSATSYWIGLIVMALGGVAFFRSRKCGKCTKSTSGNATGNSGSAAASGLTGVARYLNKKSGTGVSRYLEKQVQSVKAGAAQAATGVEKYIRNRR